jgi:hypothetical protein|mmetsp:Transcript_2767/g.5185  ORF Transcript_2767/g.5185 Transcript_2767/m.5185 type:complete len:144 (+) Transcript_2767:453-884(+)|eukprot:CAMPEP_0174291732 /NCGR_PEP_ID=MMETSP0809-20121228/33059_1 /TAXON_ID=73025 ORGANISM="Eutreptiella gymnastica-like, Strain CCMP1594" /NCGR_SAMPLE_ID=MMETSP0809 /ASSEMBLY_ACC=CAM_ASM_000658 /LENGTH=143 /DNA_ID=CAMNT_0015391273 /DNA_START=447 /DNA_END=878 /DNA_ORIENTATION=+
MEPKRSQIRSLNPAHGAQSKEREQVLEISQIAEGVADEFNKYPVGVGGKVWRAGLSRDNRVNPEAAQLQYIWILSNEQDIWSTRTDEIRSGPSINISKIAQKILGCTKEHGSLTPVTGMPVGKTNCAPTLKVLNVTPTKHPWD